jgi:cysteine synthase
VITIGRHSAQARTSYGKACTSGRFQSCATTPPDHRRFGTAIAVGSQTTPRCIRWAIQWAHRLVKENDKYLLLDQFSNPANPEAEYQTTGLQILRDVPEITHFVASMGTGGTLMELHRYFEEHKPDVSIIGLEPVAGSKIQDLCNMADYVPPIYQEELLDNKFIFDAEEALRVARELARVEGNFVGISSGAARWGGREMAKRIRECSIVVILPDGGEKYMSTPLFDLHLGSLFSTKSCGALRSVNCFGPHRL